MRIFISVQRLRNQRQELILSTVLHVLRQTGEVVIVENEDLDEAPVDPMQRIRDAIHSCQGAVVIAFTRWYMPTSTQYPDEPYAVSYASQRYCSVWNQIEAAMAFQAGLSLLVLEDAGLYQQGAISRRRTAFPVIELPASLDSSALQRRLTEAVATWLGSLSAHPVVREES